MPGNLQLVINSRVLLNYLCECACNYNPALGNASIQRKHIVDVIDRVNEAITLNNADENTVLDGIEMKIWHLEVLWVLSVAGLIHVPKYLRNNETSETVCKELAEDLARYYFMGPKSPFEEALCAGMLDHISSLANTAPDGLLLTLFAEICYGNISSTVDASTNHTPILDLIILKNMAGNPGVVLVLSNFLKLSCNDDGTVIREVIQNPHCYKPNNAKSMVGWCEKSLQCFGNPELMGVFLYDLIEGCNIESTLNWRNIALLVVTMTRLKCYSVVKSVILKLIDFSLNNSSSWHLFSALLLGKICCSKSSGLELTYLQWFSSTFSSDSHRPLNTNEKAQFVLKCLTDALEVEPPCYLKVYLHKAPCVPSACQAQLSEYLQLTKACLLTINESVELGLFPAVDGMGTADSDVHCLVQHFQAHGNISHNILALLAFRKPYLDRELFPKLESICPGKCSPHHALIKLLAQLGKISNSALAKHEQACGIVKEK